MASVFFLPSASLPVLIPVELRFTVARHPNSETHCQRAQDRQSDGGNGVSIGKVEETSQAWLAGVLADCGDGRGRGEQRETLGGGGAAEAFAHGGAGAGVGHAVVEELVGPVGSDGHGLDLVRQ